MFNFLTKSKYVYLILVSFWVVGLVAVYFWGKKVAESEFIIENSIRYEQTIERVNEGENEFRQANPSRDPSVSLDRLRERSER